MKKKKNLERQKKINFKKKKKKTAKTPNMKEKVSERNEQHAMKSLLSVLLVF